MTRKIDNTIRGLVGLVAVQSPSGREQLDRFYTRVGQFHIPVWEDVVGGRVVFLPGSDARAQKIGELFSDFKEHGAERGIKAYSGVIDDIPVLAMASGMGSGQLEIIGLELMRAMAVKGGAIIRYGSQGTLKPVPLVQVGDILLATHAIPADSSFAYMTHTQLRQGYVPQISPEITQMLISALQEIGYVAGGSLREDCIPQYHVGGIHSKGLLYAQEVGIGPRAAYFEHVKKQLEETPDLFGSEMETSLLYTMAAWINGLTEAFEHRRPILAGSLTFFIGDSNNPFHPDAEVRAKAEKNLIDTVPYVARHMYPLVKAIPPKQTTL